MPEMLHIRVAKTGEERIVADNEPVESAVLHKQLSDAIWRQKPTSLASTDFALSTSLPAPLARDRLNQVVGVIDEDLVVSGVNKTIKLPAKGSKGQLEVEPDVLAVPDHAFVGTINWDGRLATRNMWIDGELVGVEFTDDHTDYSRQLLAGFNFNDTDGGLIELTYSIDRLQPYQHLPATLNMNVWHSQFAAEGYDQHIVHSVDLSVVQELKVLDAFRVLGGVSLETV